MATMATCSIDKPRETNKLQDKLSVLEKSCQLLWPTSYSDLQRKCDLRDCDFTQHLICWLSRWFCTSRGEFVDLCAAGDTGKSVSDDSA